MKTIFPGCGYDDILDMTNLPTLHDRRRGKTGQVGDVKPLLVNEGQGNNVINWIVD